MQSSAAEKSLPADQKEHLYQALCLMALVVTITLIFVLAALLGNHSIQLIPGLLIGMAICWCGAGSIWCLVGWKYRKYPEKGVGDQPTPDDLSRPMLCMGVLGGTFLAYALIAAMSDILG